jgi:hypothetical protein
VSRIVVQAAFQNSFLLENAFFQFYFLFLTLASKSSEITKKHQFNAFLSPKHLKAVAKAVPNTLK